MSVEKENLLQVKLREFISNRLGKDPWLTIMGDTESPPVLGGDYCALIPNNLVKECLSHESWDLMWGSGFPSCSIYKTQGKDKIVFKGVENEFGAIPFIIPREFHKIRNDYYDILEEFRLFHNLYEDKNQNKYLKIDENGNEEPVIEIKNESVRINLKYLRQFLTVRQCHFAVYFDSVVFSDIDIGSLQGENLDFEFKKKLTRYVFKACESDWMGDQERSLSRLLGKSLIPPLPENQMGIWPFGEAKKQYEKFIIGQNSNGSNKYYTCDPKRLANYFGANPEAPNYLTPIFFRKDVLAKYYANPEKYTVGDSRLRCGGLWTLRMDNNNKDYIVVFLGDLGQDLSHEEQIYWKSFNQIPQGKISRTAFKRGFLAQFAV